MKIYTRRKRLKVVSILGRDDAWSVRWLRNVSKECIYTLKMDVGSFFDSILSGSVSSELRKMYGDLYEI
jgi:hypothetical protein